MVDGCFKNFVLMAYALVVQPTACPYTLLKSEPKAAAESDSHKPAKVGWGRKLRSMAVVGSLITFATQLFSHSA